MIEYGHTADGITERQLGGFFENWPQPPSRETHLRLLRASDQIVLAVDAESGDVVGFITAVSDGILSAYIPLLEVRADHRGRGIGRELVRRMLARLERLYMVDLTCDAALQPFYRAAGMQKAVGMSIRNYDRQSGDEPTIR
jgi:ribosomal protein S18 acetylase RimI-like enzyme